MKKGSSKTILAIETSCDETAAAVLSMAPGKRFPEVQTLSSVVKSQIKLHSKMGGVVPEVAARAHVKNILPVVEKSLQTTNYRLQAIDYIAVTIGPGLIPSLIVGVEFAKALSLATGKPIIPVNHLEGHLYSPFSKLPATGYELQANIFPMISLIVSGGHTILTLMKNERTYKVLGQTVDDAAGEAFDKVAKLLGLPYPGGPEVSKLARQAKQPVTFPRPMINSKNYNFSFAGLKTSVLYYLRDSKLQTTNYQLQTNICAGFQNAVVDVLTSKALKAAKEFKAKAISLSGGVSANAELRNQLRSLCEQNNLKFFVPGPGLSTDNAEMIGLAASFKLQNGHKPQSYKTIKPDPNLEL